MDQLTPIFSWLKRNVFWWGCAILAIAMVGIWFLATKSLAEETAEREGTLNASISSAKRILGVSAEDGVKAHPNASSEAGMAEELEKTAKSIVKAWRSRGIAQKNLMVWPEELESQELIDFFEKYNPPERYTEILQTERLIQPGLLLYGKKIPDRMNYLCGDEVLRARWNYGPKNGDVSDDRKSGGTEGGEGGIGSPGGLTEDIGALNNKSYAVIWSDVNQKLWNDKLHNFFGRDDNISQSTSPTAFQCYMLQQDLWLLEAMFKIIRKVNGNSNANDLSPIKRLDHIAIGREATGKLGELTLPNDVLGKGAPEVEDDTEELTEEEARAKVQADMKAAKSRNSNKGAGGSGMDGGADAAAAKANIKRSKKSFNMGKDDVTSSDLPFHLRYVDSNYNPLPADIIEAITNGELLPDQNIELVVAKRVPVRIALRMDENKIAEFMAACANSPFAFEIQQVRLNKHKPGGEKIDQKGDGGSSNAARDKMNRMGNFIPGGSESGTSASLASKNVEVRTNYDVDVEFFGIVKIYNPVREDFLFKAIGIKNGNAKAKPNSNDAATAKPADNGNSIP